MNLSFDDKRKKFDELSLDGLDNGFDPSSEENSEEQMDIDEQDVIIEEEFENLSNQENTFDEVDESDNNSSTVDVDNDKNIIDDELDTNDKKTDTEIVNEYLKPNQRCILCNTPIWALKLNKAYLDGLSYSQMIDKFSAKFEERANRSLNKSLLQRHFRSHFDVRAAAIAEYNKRRNSSSGSISTTTAQRDIFKLATNKYIDELEMFDATSKEMIVKYQELEQLIEEKKDSGKSFGIDELILKQATILNSLNKQAISKFKALSKVDLESKQGQFLSQLGFIGNKAIAGLSQMGGKQPLLSSQQTEEIYLNVVIKQMLARLEEPLKSTFGQLSKDQKALFYRELRKSMEGIQDGITVDFDRQIKTQTKLITDKQLNQNNHSI